MAVDEKHKPVTDEIASAATDIDMFQGWLPVLENPDKVLNLEAGGDITVYDSIGRDPRVASGLRTRAKAVTGREWQIIPFSQEKIDLQVADYVEKVFLGFSYDLARRSVLRGGVLKGFSVAEVMWDCSEGDTFIADLRYRHQRRFRFTPEGRLHLLTFDNPYPGKDVTVNPDTGLLLKKFQVFTFGDEVTTPYGVGLGQELYWPWWFKKNGIKFWLMYADKYAGPTAAGEYDTGTPVEKQRELLSAAQAIHSNSAIVYPKGMNLRLIEAMRSGSISCYTELCNFMNEEMTIAILGQTATTIGKPGALGGSDEQADVRSDYLKDDADSLCAAQNDRTSGIIAWLVDYQFPGLKRYPKIWIKTEDEQDGKTLAERDDKLASAMEKGGRYRLSKSYYLRTHGMEQDDIEEVTPADVSDPSTKSDKPDKPEKSDKSVSFSDCPHCRGLSFAEGEASDAAEQLSLQAHQAADGSDLVAAIRQHLEGARDLPSALDQFTELRRELDLKAVSETIARACMVADLTGRFDVKNEVAAQEAFHFAEGTALPFDEALDFFRQKLNLKTETWTELWKGGHSRAFTVAGAMRDDMLGDFRDAIVAALEQGTTHAAFLKDFDAIVERYGWSYNGSRGWRSKVIYDTNVRTAYNAGRWKQLTDPELVQLNPYLEYRHGDSRHPRPMHQSWNGIVLPASDPWWNTHYTPNGWGCKCRVFSVGPRDLASKGKTGPDQAPDDGTYEWVDKKSGEVHDVPVGIDAGWDYNPGKEWLNPATGKRESL